MKKANGGAASRRLRSWFPEREFIMRSEGQVRFIRISSRLQMWAAGVVAGVATAWLATMGGVAIHSLLESRAEWALLDRQARVERAENRIAAYRRNIDAVAEDLVRRQAFIEQTVRTHVGELPTDSRSGETVSDSRTEASRTVTKVSTVLPEAAPLARIEAEQIVFVERLTRLADRRASAAAAAMRRLGLNPARIAAPHEDRSAMGGPLIALSEDEDGMDPRFTRLGLSLARMDALERGLQGIPQVLPASIESVSSGFGVRRDPFNGRSAFHAGLDFRGPIGTPIMAAARGKVSFVGRKPGYGNCVEIDHGNGLLTRYAHMSAFRSRIGQTVSGGQVIGLVGNTGRSTGPHLHFEVRINGRAVNPRPFLEEAPDVLKEIRRKRAAG